MILFTSVSVVVSRTMVWGELGMSLRGSRSVSGILLWIFEARLAKYELKASACSCLLSMVLSVKGDTNSKGYCVLLVLLSLSLIICHVLRILFLLMVNSAVSYTHLTLPTIA